MHIVVVGVDQTTASIELRERLTYSADHIPQVLSRARQVAQESVLLSTCNRLELYAVCLDIRTGRMDLLDVLSETSEVEPAELQAHCYDFADEEAVTHLFEVTCGLHALVPGETQIQGQVAKALEIALGGRYSGPITSAFFRGALGAGKRARSETGISRNAASVSLVAVKRAKQLFPELHEKSVLLVGSGKMSELAAHHLCDHGAQRLIIISRTPLHALDLARRFGSTQRSFVELTTSLVEADVVISSTTAPGALITYEMMQEVMQRRSGRPLLLIDIALPRDVDPAVAALPGVNLYNLDDLQTVAGEGIRLRQREVEQVQEIIAQETSVFDRWLRSRSVVDTISDLRQQAEVLCQQEVMRTLRRLPPTLSERETDAVRELATRLVHKLLHAPTLRLKDAAAEGQGHMYTEALRYLFDLKEQPDEPHSDWNSSQQAGNDTDTVGRRAVEPARANTGGSDRAHSYDR